MNALTPRRVLLLAYHFPPLGGAGVQRTLKYVKYLPDFGWQPVTITGPARGGALSDPTLLDELRGAAVIRTRAALLPAWLPWRVRNTLSRWLLVADDQAGWGPFALAAATRLIRRGGINALYTTSTPYTAHLVGLRLKRRFGLPWVADFRDPWAENTALKPPTAWHRQRIRGWEAQVMSAADRVTVVSEPMAAAMRAAYPKLPPAHFLTLPNGYDPDDFLHAPLRPPEPEPHMTWVYSGSFYGERRAQPFLQALHAALAAGRIPRARVRVRLVGNVGQAAAEDVRSLGLQDVVELPGYLPHRESIGHLLAADALLLMVAPGPGSAGVLTGKLFEYLAAAKPILGLTPPSAAAELIRESRAGVVIDPGDAAGIEQQIVDWFEQWQRGELHWQGDPAVVARFDRRRLAGQLAETLQADKVAR